MKKLAELRAQMTPESRARAEAKAQESLLDQFHFELVTDGFKQFSDRLDAPGKANPGLERLMEVCAPWSTSSVSKK